MRMAKLIQPGRVIIDPVQPPVAGPGQALVKVVTVGICGSDVHAFHGKHPFIRCPVVPGHEFAGVVLDTGAGVSDKWTGKRVTSLPSLVCGRCHNCMNGRYNICSSLRVIGCQADGAMAECVVVPGDLLVELSDAVSFEQGAMIEPVAVAVRAVRRAGAVGGACAFVVGAGTIGLLVMQVLRVYGARRVVVSDVNDSRLELAAELGADHVVNPNRTDIPRWIQSEFGSDGVDVSFECVGVQPTVEQCILSVRKGSRVVIAGVFEDDVMVPMGLVQDREIELIGTLMYTLDDFREATRLVEGDLVQVLPLVSHRFALSEVQEAFETASNPASGTVKVLIAVS